jgi:co-chaperonin GroES (HSP10)
VGLLDGIEPTQALDVERFRPLRGRVVVKEHKRPSAGLWTPEGNPRERTSHRGTVLAIGPAMRTRKGYAVPHGFAVGDEVYFCLEYLEKPRAFPDDVVVLAQEEVLAVVEP